MAPEPGALFISSIKQSVNRGLTKSPVLATIDSLYAPVYTRRVCAIYITSIKSVLGGGWGAEGGWLYVSICGNVTEGIFVHMRVTERPMTNKSGFPKQAFLEGKKKEKNSLLCCPYVQPLFCRFTGCNT